MAEEIIVDTDPGIDDAMALMYLSNEPSVEITDITTVPGNSSSKKVLKNANYLEDFFDLEAPVYRGPQRPLKKDLETATSHGESGLGPIEPGEDYLRSEGRSFEALLENAGEGKHLLTLGPLTNVALAIEEDEDLLQKYESVTIMGGGIEYGNHSRSAEFNFWVDPEAADKVVQASGDKRIVPGDICYELQLDFNELDELELNDNFGQIVDFYISQYQEWGYDGGVMYDPLAASLTVNPNYGEVKDMDLRVEPVGEYTRGETVPQNDPGAEKNPNSNVYRKIDKNKIKDHFMRVVK